MAGWEAWRLAVAARSTPLGRRLLPPLFALEAELLRLLLDGTRGPSEEAEAASHREQPPELSQADGSWHPSCHEADVWPGPTGPEPRRVPTPRGEPRVEELWGLGRRKE